jgi:hypothetical protein
MAHLRMVALWVRILRKIADKFRDTRGSYKTSTFGQTKAATRLAGRRVVRPLLTLFPLARSHPGPPAVLVDALHPGRLQDPADRPNVGLLANQWQNPLAVDSEHAVEPTCERRREIRG